MVEQQIHTRSMAEREAQAAAAAAEDTDVTMSDVPASQQGPGAGAGSAQVTASASVAPAPTTSGVLNAIAGVGQLQVGPGAPTYSDVVRTGSPPDPRRPQIAPVANAQSPASEQPASTEPPSRDRPEDPTGSTTFINAVANAVKEAMGQTMHAWLSGAVQVPAVPSQPAVMSAAPVQPALPAQPAPAAQIDMSSSKLTARDVKLPMFSGSSDPEARHIDSAYYLPLLEWINETRTLLHFSGLPPRLQALAIFNALEGPARRVATQNGMSNNSTPDALLDKLVNAIPDHGTVFTTRALNMHFKLKSLRKDIEVFGLLVSHGEIAHENTRFWFHHLTRKLLAAKPDLLTLSASLLNISLDYRPQEPFQHLIARAVDIVTRLQQEGVLVQNLGSAANGDVGESAGRRGNAPGKRKPAQSETASKRPKVNKGPSFEELAKQYSRCSKCGFHHSPGAALSKHEASCPGDAAKFKSRMGRVRALVAKGKGSQVNAFPGN